MYAPDDAWIHADDGFDRQRCKFETQYFHTTGDSRITLPPGAAKITVWRGMENADRAADGADQAPASRAGPASQSCSRSTLPADWSKQWQSADVHVHMNYGGAYRDTPERSSARPRRKTSTSCSTWW